MRPADTVTIRRPPVSGARAHVVGVVLLALLLQAALPLLHARLQMLYAVLAGQRIDVAAFCLPGHLAPPVTRDADGLPPAAPPGPAGCLLCQGTGAPASDIALPADVITPTVARITTPIAGVTAHVYSAAVARSNRPRGPPVV